MSLLRDLMTWLPDSGDLMTWLPESWQDALGGAPETIALRARLDYALARSLNGIRDEALRIATEHGFTDATPAEDIALMHSELSEALEDIRAGKSLAEIWFEGVDRKPIGVPSELADVVIRIAHFCGKHKIDLASAVFAKMSYNERRPFKHGKKF